MSLVQYIILRKDLQTVYNWPLGALIAQACHASSAIIHMFKDDANTKVYLDDLDNMHKVVSQSKNLQVLAAPDEEALIKLSQKLSEKKIDFKMWTEQPENIVTCIAVKPYPKSEIKSLVQNFKLYS